MRIAAAEAIANVLIHVEDSIILQGFQSLIPPIMSLLGDLLNSKSYDDAATVNDTS